MISSGVRVRAERVVIALVKGPNWGAVALADGHGVEKGDDRSLDGAHAHVDGDVMAHMLDRELGGELHGREGDEGGSVPHVLARTLGRSATAIARADGELHDEALVGEGAVLRVLTREVEGPGDVLHVLPR